MLYFFGLNNSGKIMEKQEIESEVTGNVWKVLKSAGDTVAEGEVIMI